MRGVFGGRARIQPAAEGIAVHEPLMNSQQHGNSSAQSSAQIGGEEALVQRLFAPLAVGAAGAFGLRDDAACLTPTAGHDVVVTTDAIAAGVHFLPGDPPRDIGWKALAVNLSDLAAKGATPRAYLMALAMPELPVSGWLDEFAAGLRQAQEAHGCHLIGGDTDRRPGPLSVTITALGEVPAGRMVRRGTARVGDLVYVTGTLGDAAIGLMLRSQSALAGAWGLSPDQAGQLQARYLRPQPRTALAPALLAHASAAMDVSDGLLKDLARMCRASGTRADIAFAALPLSDAGRAAHAGDAALAQAIVAGGDDYELLVAVPEAAAVAFERAAAMLGVPVSRIGRHIGRPGRGEAESGAGRSAAADVVLRDAAGVPLSLVRDGWDHF